MEVTEETVFLELNSYLLRDACGRKREWFKFKLVNLENSAFQHNNQITQHSLFIADSIVNNRSCLQLRNFYRQHLPEAKKWQICNKCRNSPFVLHSWWKENKSELSLTHASFNGLGPCWPRSSHWNMISSVPPHWESNQIKPTKYMAISLAQNKS